jgi:hypothetical protein
VTLSPAEEVMEAIEGATIVSGDVNEGDGLHLHLQDGRVFVITVIRGCMALAILSPESEKLH